MTREVLTIAGQVIGAYFGGPVGSAIGGAIGAYIGNAIDPIEGPKLDDLRVQVASYGYPIPLLYGTVRTAGIVIWAADLEEGDSGGKGGPEAQGTVYYATFAVLLSRNRLRGIRRAWANGVQIYNDVVQEDMALPDNLDIAFYRGTEDQLPDPTMEAALGAGNVPAYRGFGYVVINRMSLEKFGNRIPNIEFEVVAEQQWVGGDPYSLVGTSLDDEPSNFNWSKILYREDGTMVLLGGTPTGNVVIRGFDPRTEEYGPAVVQDFTVSQMTDALYAQRRGLYYVVITSGNSTYVREYVDIDHTENREWLLSSTFPPVQHYPAGSPGAYLAYDAAHNSLNVIFASQFTTLNMHRIDLTSGLLGKREFDAGPYSFGTGWGTGGANVHIALTTAGFQAVDITPPLSEGATWGNSSSSGEPHLDVESYEGDTPPSESLEWVTHAVTAASYPRAAYDVVRNHYVVIDINGSLWTVTDEVSPVTTLETDLVPSGSFTGGNFDIMYMSGLDAIVVVTDGGKVWVFDAEDYSALMSNYSLPDASGGLPAIRQSVLDPGAIFVAGSPLLDGTSRFYEQPLYSEQVGLVVGKICQAAGYEEADYDSSELTQRLRGYRVAQAGPLRPALEQLASIYRFTGAEGDDQLLFKLRGGASVATFTSEDCVIDANDARPVRYARAQETSLPRRLALTAPELGEDYQALTQRSERQAVQAGEDVSMSTDAVLLPDECKRAADWLIFDAWMARDTAATKLTLAALRVIGGECITLDGRRMRVISKTLNAMALEVTLTADDASLIVQYGSGATGGGEPPIRAIPATLGMALLRTPLLRDQDDDYGLYWTIWPIAGTFSKATLQARYADGSSDWESSGSTVSSPGATVGYTVNALGDWDGLNCFDEGEALNVRFVNGAPASASRSDVLGGANLALIGDELVHFRDATLEADGSYTLAGFLRARRGTESAAVDHGTGERVVMLHTTTIGTFNNGAGVQGLSIRYSPAQHGRVFDGVPSEVASLSAYRLVPVSVVDVRGERDSSDDLTLTWKRRSRKSRSFVGSAGIYVPLGEASEAYVVEILDGTDLVRTITVTGSPTTTYTAAQQTTDFGAPQASVAVRIAQTAERVPAPLRWNYREATV